MNYSSHKSDWFPSDADAIRAAREEVKNMFRTSEQLTRIQPYLQECIRKKQAVETQLSSAVRTQVDETRLGLQLLTEASAMMTKMRANFMAIDQYSKDCKLVLRDSPEIQRVNTARKNLDATTRLLDKFRSLPEQAESLMDQLDSDDRSLKDVYKSLRKLFQLRDSAMDAPGTSSSAAGNGFSADFQHQLQENFAELSKAADEMQERIWENISDASFLAKDDPIVLVRTLEVIELEDRAMRKVFSGHKKDDSMVAPSPPSKDSKGGKGGKPDLLRMGTTPSSNSTEFLGSSTNMTMREKCLHALEKSIADQFQHLHIDEEQHREQEKKEQAEKRRLEKLKEERRKAAAAAAAAAQPKSPNNFDDDVDEPEDVPSPLKPNKGGGLYFSEEDAENDNLDLDDDDGRDASRDLNGPSDYILTILEEMTDLAETLPQTLIIMEPCFPPDYNLASFYIERYIRWLKLTLSFHTNDPTKLSKKAQLRTVNWIEWYRSEMKKWEVKFPGCRAPIIDPNLSHERQLKDHARKELAESHYFDELVKELMRSYTGSTEETLMKLCDNILHSDIHAEAERNSEGHYVTSGPSDLFYTINSTIEIVLSNFGLNAKPLSFVCVMLSRIFEHYQNRQLNFLGAVSRGEKDQDDQLFFSTAEDDDNGEEGEIIHKSDTYFAAIINNSTTCQEHMDDLKDKILDRIREAEALESSSGQPATMTPTLVLNNTPHGSQPRKTLLENMEDLFEESGEGFVSVASEGIDLLVLQISITLQKPMSNLFTPSWLKDSGVTDDIVLTLQDFMGDYQKWIGRDAYFSRMLVKCLHSVIAEYLRILTLTKPQVSSQLFERLKQDKNILQGFFETYTLPEHGSVLPTQLLKNELRLLTLVNKVVHEDVDFMSVHFDKLIARFGHSAGEVMEGLISMRTDLTKAQRQEVMAKFHEKLPRANPQELLEKQLVAQNVAAMASPKNKSRRAGGGGEEGETSIKSLWERFKSRDKNEKMQKKVVKKVQRDEDGMTLSEFAS